MADNYFSHIHTHSDWQWLIFYVNKGNPSFSQHLPLGENWDAPMHRINIMYGHLHFSSVADTCIIFFTLWIENCNCKVLVALVIVFLFDFIFYLFSKLYFPFEQSRDTRSWIHLVIKVFSLCKLRINLYIVLLLLFPHKFLSFSWIHRSVYQA